MQTPPGKQRKGGEAGANTTLEAAEAANVHRAAARAERAEVGRPSGAIPKSGAVPVGDLERKRDCNAEKNRQKAVDLLAKKVRSWKIFFFTFPCLRIPLSFRSVCRLRVLNLSFVSSLAGLAVAYVYCSDPQAPASSVQPRDPKADRRVC